MQIARLSIERPLYTWILILFCLVGGAAGYFGVGKLEDPVFTLKSAIITTAYPGATAAEVAIEVSEVLESEIQQMNEVDFVTSSNTPGLSVVEVTIRDTFGGDELAQVWDDLRDRVADAQSKLPAGAVPSSVNDSFGDVYGLLYAVTAPGYDDATIWDIATFLRRELLTVDGVANAELRGLPEEAIFIEPSGEILTALGVSPDVIVGAVSAADEVVPTGTASNGRQDLRVDAPAPDDSVSEISALTFGVQGEILNLTDVAEVYRARIDAPRQMIRHNGAEAFTIGVSGLNSENIVAVGQRVEDRIDEIATLLPVGVTLAPIYEQHRVVDTANSDFLANLAMSVAVVIGVLALFMGWRAAVVVGGSLLLTVSFTFFFMYLFDIKVERISLGALIIAMGMLVDNAIVVAEGMQIQMKRGRKAVAAATEVAARTQVPLLGATIIGIMAFAGIGLSPDSSGEFLFSLFAVIGISLLLSWLLAVTVTPLLGSYFFVTDTNPEAKDPYDTVFFRSYGKVVRGALRARWLVIMALIGAMVAGLGAMGMVKQQFFPPATTPIFYLNYKAAQGTAIETARDDLAQVEAWLLEQPQVEAVTTTVGASMTRFLLTYPTADPSPSYGQLVIRMTSSDVFPELAAGLTDFTARTIPWAETRVQQIIYGPPVSADVELRLSGPDPMVLRGLADEAQDILKKQTDLLVTERIDWRERELTTQPIFATDRAQALGITRQSVSQVIALATDGLQVGTFREADRQLPILIRTPRHEQLGGEYLLDQPIYAPSINGYTTLDQVLDGFNVIARDTVIARRDRTPTISVQAFTIPGVLAPEAFAQVRNAIEDMPLPPGYRMEWGGEFESSSTAQESLGRQMPLAFGTMLLITILLFGKLRQTAVIWTVVPMGVTGVGFGLLFTNLPFSFTALLGLLSLSGMLIKNAIVLVEEIDNQKSEEGLAQSEAIVTASVSRLRPVVLAAATTILGMVPLLTDAFFASMAVAIMAGLGFASVLTLIGVPALYHTYMRKERRAEKAATNSAKTPGLLMRLLSPAAKTGPKQIAAE
ncbi:multidrug efflux pump subunit AcrB [Loktanella sp. PT4BL]|jgi:multidrug efflux pump subunit AcrB|uniref:efflux RND transporter permease subunit n=1 Tax=Loktanella sp. PT4BL TaxID=2135611 RepID=UPI000D772AC0|nr:efflux RND transporter permease subunit [Loktanella sp. PT4BL]PXW72410.1 multidrug efflux pump subunit AcrB [Loktanella sp. PT4BL]